MTAALEIAPQVGVKAACDALNVSRATVYRRRCPRLVRARPRPARALADEERARILEVLHAPRFVDCAPVEVYAALLDEGVYIASASTMYRVLRESRSVRERRAIRRHPSYARPELRATSPNQVWSWDITKVRGPDRRDWFHLYVMLDVFSRKVVGWLLAAKESAKLAEQWIAETLANEGIAPGMLTVHSDRGTSMRSKTVAELLDDLGVTKSHSRPRTSDDNAFSEAAFKTVKYHSSYPGSFASVQDGREYFALFFSWYNTEHHHSGIAMLTPDVVHYGRVEEVLAVRQAALDAMYAAHPERFVHGRPKVARPPVEVWINRPTQQLDLPNGVDGLPSTPHKAMNSPEEPRPCPVGPPAQESNANAEGVAGLAEATGRVAPSEARQR
jgi:putative transposase